MSFVEWTVPGSHPHDPLAAADGSIWYTGQMASTLGRLDPKTGVFKEYRTNTPDSGPHGLIADEDGNIWFTANFAGYIGKLDPKTCTAGCGQVMPAGRPIPHDHPSALPRSQVLLFLIDPESSRVVRRIRAQRHTFAPNFRGRARPHPSLAFSLAVS